MTKKIAVPVHVAVLSEGTLRLVKSDGAGGLIEVGVLAVGPDAARKGLADVVSAAQVMAEMAGVLGGGNPPAPPVEKDGGEPAPAAGPRAVAVAPAGKKQVAKRKYARDKRSKETRFNDDDIIDVIRQALQRGEPGLRPVEIAQTICERVGEEYHGKEPLARAVGNKLRPMQREGLIVRRDYDGLYTLPGSPLGGDKSVETVDNSEADGVLVGAGVVANGAGPNESWLELREG